MVHLTICLPTRNRQAYCIKTITALAQAGSTDFEVIVSDNSDDPEPLGDFFAQQFSDPRFRLIPPGPSVLSMVDNWERVVSQAEGRWISVIGDDDYIDPRLAGVIRRYEVLYRDVDAISWERMTYQWPDNRPVPTLASIPLTHGTRLLSHEGLADQLYRWSERKRSPGVGVGIYHGAIKRSLMQRIRDAYGGRYFEHPIVDWENTCKVLAQSKRIVHSERPFSVLGSCVASNSASGNSSEVLKTRNKVFIAESSGSIELYQPFFPFAFDDPGTTLCQSIAAVTAWFCDTYGQSTAGFAVNFAHAAMDECRFSADAQAHAAKVGCFSRGFAEWEGGKWASHFKPAPFSPPRTINQLSGLNEDRLYVREADIGAQTPQEFYCFGEHAIIPVDSLINGTTVFAL